MSKVIMQNGDFTVLKVFQRAEGKSKNPYIHIFSFLLAQHPEPQSSSAKLSLSIIPIGIAAYAFTLLLNVCRSTAVCSEEKSYTPFTKYVDCR